MTSGGGPGPLDGLTPKERECLRLVYRNLEAVVTSAGGHMSDVVRLGTFVARSQAEEPAGP